MALTAAKAVQCAVRGPLRGQSLRWRKVRLYLCDEDLARKRTEHASALESAARLRDIFTSPG